MPKLKWNGIMPKTCDICGKKLEREFIDGRINGTKIDKDFLAPWAIMCTKCFETFGVGLGLGKGQKYSIPGGQKIE